MTVQSQNRLLEKARKLWHDIWIGVVSAIAIAALVPLAAMLRNMMVPTRWLLAAGCLAAAIGLWFACLYLRLKTKKVENLVGVNDARLPAYSGVARRLALLGTVVLPLLLLAGC
jgi:hypothetical protein